ncbi:hypothetical protein [Alteromonas sp. AMM-1]|uniref:hypothetical protein n=1 Tax=Alteromonas sp. AMM-1 TaxID=3394233 RepID=UPI0039A5AD4F
MFTKHIRVISVLWVVVGTFASSVHAAVTEEDIIALSLGAYGRFPLLDSTMSIHDNHALYDQARSTLAVGIEFKNVHDDLLAENLIVYVNGYDVTYLDPGTAYTVFIPSGNPANPYGEAGAFLEYPLNLTKQYPLANITAELIHMDTGIVIAREKVVVLETTQDNLTGFTGVPSVNEGLNFQLTGYGIGGDGDGNPTGLEHNVSETFPVPSHAYFTNELNQAVQAIPTTTRTELEACIELDKLDDNRFSNILEFPAYAEAFAIATATYAAFEGCRSSGLGAAVCSRSCVKKPPLAKHFKLCVNTMEGEPVSGAIGNTHDIELSALTNSSVNEGLIRADVELHDFRGDVDIHLQDMSIEWRNDNRCIGRPRADIPQSQVDDRDWLSEFAVCHTTITANTVDSTARRGVSPVYGIFSPTDDTSQIEVDDATLGVLKLVQPTENASVGACAETFLNQTAKDIVRHFSPKMEKAVNDTFNANSPDTMLAETIELALQPLELVDIKSTGIEMNHTFESIKTAPESGLTIKYRSSFTPLVTESLGVPVSRYVVQGTPMYSDLFYSLDNYGNTVSSNHGYTSSWLNHLMYAKGQSFILNKTFTFTEAQLGTKEFGDSTQTFDGSVLTEIHPGLDYLKGQTVEIGMYRNLNPFFYQVEDPNPVDLVPLVGSPNSFIMEGVRVVVKAPNEVLSNGETVIGETFIELSLGLFEEEFDLFHDEAFQVPYLEPTLIADLVNKMSMDIISFNSPSCAKIKHERGTADYGACERVIERGLKAFMYDHLYTMMDELLSDIPAVQYYVSESDDKQVQQQIQQTSRFHNMGRVNIAGYLPN